MPAISDVFANWLFCYRTNHLRIIGTQVREDGSVWLIDSARLAHMGRQIRTHQYRVDLPGKGV